MDIKIGGENNLNIIRGVSPTRTGAGWLPVEEPELPATTFSDRIQISIQNNQPLNFQALGRNSFYQLDLDGDGVVNRDEWLRSGGDENIFTIASHGKNEITRTDWNLFIDQLEAAQLSAKKNLGTWNLFDFYAMDLDRDNNISRTEWTLAGGNSGVFDAFPKNENGEITIQTWTDLMNRL